MRTLIGTSSLTGSAVWADVQAKPRGDGAGLLITCALRVGMTYPSRVRFWWLCVAVVGILLGAATLSACSHGRNYYHRAPFVNGNRTDPGFAEAAHDFVDLLSQGQQQAILDDRTSPGYQDRMTHFLDGYAGQPTTLVDLKPGNDNVADEVLEVACRSGVGQGVALAWGWFDGAWRAWPQYRLTATGKVAEFPGCT